MKKMKLNQQKHYLKQRGFTLIELLISVAIGILVVGVGIYKAPTVMASYRAGAEISELPQIVTNTQKAYANNPNFTSATLDTIIRLDAFPQNRVTIPGSGAATATNRWGGAITFASGTISGQPIGRYNYAAVPSAECKSVLTAVAQGFRRIYVDSANSGTMGTGTVVKNDGQELDNAALGTACSGVTNSITYDFAK